MSDPTPSDDELISSYIDGEATLDEVARIQADPELRARIQEFEAAKDLLSTPVTPLPESDVDRLIDNALWQSNTSDRISDLSAVRAMRRFSPQRLATIAASLVLLAGVVGALIALNSDSGDEISAETSADSSAVADDHVGDDGDDMAEPYDSGDDMADDGDDMADAMPESDEMAESGDDMAAEMPESDMADDGDMAEDGDDMAEPSDSEQSVADDQTAATTTVAAVDSRRSYRLLNLEIAESYETLDKLIVQTTSQWRELVDAGATLVPQVIDEQGIAEQALANVPCGQRLHASIDTLDHIAGSGGISVGETTIAGAPLTVVVVELSIDTAVLLTAGEPDCAAEQLETLTP